MPVIAIDVVTIFPAMIEAGLAEGVVGRARERGLIDVRARDLRDFTTDRHRTVDDVPYGGGPGMVMKPEPLFRAVEAIAAERGAPDAVVLMTPQGRLFTQDEAQRLSRMARLIVICKCLAPLASAVMNGRLMSVCWALDSSFLAFSAASRSRCRAMASLRRSMPCSC